MLRSPEGKKYQCTIFRSIFGVNKESKLAYATKYLLTSAQEKRQSSPPLKWKKRVTTGTCGSFTWSNQTKKVTKHEYKAQTTADLTINHSSLCWDQGSHVLNFLKTTLCRMHLSHSYSQCPLESQTCWQPGEQYNGQTVHCNLFCPPMDSKWRCHLQHDVCVEKQKCWKELSLKERRGNVCEKFREAGLWMKQCSWFSLERKNSEQWSLVGF